MKPKHLKSISLSAVCILIFVILANGQNQKTISFAPSSGKKMTTKTPTTIEVARKLFETFNRHDAETLAGFYAAETFADPPDYPQPKRQPAEIKDYYAVMFKQSPDIYDDVKMMTAEGNRVFIEFVSTGTMENPSKDMPPDVKGKKFSLKIAAILEIENGKIKRDVSYFDQLSILKQLGLMRE